MPFVSQGFVTQMDIQERERFGSTNVPLGYHPTTHETFYLPDIDRYAGTYVLGCAGYGQERAS